MPDEPQPTSDDLAGYPTPAELAKGYRASSQEAQRQKTRADQEAQTRADLERQLAQYRAQTTPPANPAQRLAEYGVPVDALDEYVNTRLAAAFEPLARGQMARNSMLVSYPDYQKYEADVAQYVGSDPALNQKYQRIFASDPEAALEFAFLKFGETRRGQTQPGPSPQQTVRSESQIPSNRTGDARTQPNGAEQEMLTRAWEHFQKTGNPTAYAKARLRQVIPDEFLSR